MPIRPRTPLHDMVDRLYIVSAVLVGVSAVVLMAAIRFPDAGVVRALKPLGNHWLILVAISAWVVLSAIRTHLRGSIFPDEPSGHVRFQESGASGTSYQSYWARYRGSEGGLEVIVTDSELWSRSEGLGRWLFGSAGAGLENRIPLGVICAATVVGWGLRRRCLIDYYDASGTPQRLALAVRDRQGFLTALRAGNPSIRIADG